MNPIDLTPDEIRLILNYRAMSADTRDRFTAWIEAGASPERIADFDLPVPKVFTPDHLIAAAELAAGWRYEEIHGEGAGNRAMDEFFKGADPTAIQTRNDAYSLAVEALYIADDDDAGYTIGLDEALDAALEITTETAP